MSGAANKFLLGLILFTAIPTYAVESGKCIAYGKVGGESEVCAKFDNTNAEQCKKADGWAFCGWRPTPIGSGRSLEVSCVDSNKKQTIYDADGAMVTKVGEKMTVTLKFPTSEATVKVEDSLCQLKPKDDDVEKTLHAVCKDSQNREFYNNDLLFANSGTLLDSTKNGLTVVESYQAEPTKFSDDMKCQFIAITEDSTK